MMVETIGRCDTPKENIQHLLHVKQTHFPEQPLDWDHLLDVFARPSKFSGAPFQERMKFLIMRGMSDRVDALAFTVWRDHIIDMIHTATFNIHNGNFHFIQIIRTLIAHFEAQYYYLKEITTILELAVWKLRMNENIPQEKATPRQKKFKTDELITRQQCHVTSGADVVIGHVLPFLITT
jgi:hypothetical protein